MDTFELEFGDEPSASTQAARPAVVNNKYLDNSSNGGSALSARPRGARVIAEDPEKGRIVGRVVTQTQPTTEPASTAGVADRDPLLESPSPPPPVFEGAGLDEAGTLRARSLANNDDEFDYAFEGGRREGEFHKQVFRPKAMPAHLVSNVKQSLNTEVLAEAEEEEEEEEEEPEEEEEEEGEECDTAAGESCHQRGASGRRSQGKGVRPINSWTTFAVESSHMDNLVDDMSASVARSGQACSPDVPAAMGAGDAAGAAAGGRGKQPAEDLPSFKVMQALHAASPAKEGRAAELSAPAGTAGNGVSAAAGETGPSGAQAPQRMPTPPARGGTAAANGGAAGAAKAAATAAATAPAADVAARANGLNGGMAPPRPPGATEGASPRPGPRGPAAPQAPAAPAEEDEWEVANRERQREMGLVHGVMGPPSGAHSSAPDPASPLTYHEALVHFMAMDMSATRGAAQASLPPPPGVLARLLCLGPPDLRPALLREQLLQLLCLARLGFDGGDAMHLRLLGSVYAAFTGKSSEQPRFGSHWADLGFQGQDPATDLRGCGMLGLVQLLYLHQWNGEAAHKLYTLSRHPVQEFPLAIVSLNVTKWTLQALRSGCLHRAANSRGSVVEAAQQFYAGCMATFYSTWLRGRKTMRDSGHVLKDLENQALKKPGLMLEAAERPALPDPPAP